MLYNVSLGSIFGAIGGTIPVIGVDETEAIAGALQEIGALRDVIALYHDTRPDMATVVARAAPPASDPNQWPDADAIRAIVADWRTSHPEFTAVRA